MLFSSWVMVSNIQYLNDGESNQFMIYVINAQNHHHDRPGK